MAAAAVSCSLVSRGCWNNNRAVSGHSAAGAVGSSATTTTNAGNKASLVWDPLHRRHVMLRSSRSSAYLSSASSAPSTSFALSRDFTGMRKRRSAVPRASGRGEQEEKAEQRSEMSRMESESRSPSNVEKSFSEAPQSMWSHIVSSAAKPAVVAVMMALLLAQPVEDSLAASSGGRMGGKAFSSAPRPSAPSRSYSGGGGGGGGRAYSGGGGGGVYVAPPIYGSPYGYSPFGYSPFYGGGYGGGFLGPSVGFGGGGTIILAMIAFATLRAVVGFVRDRFRGDDEDRFDD